MSASASGPARLRTPLCDQLGIQVPILLAGMAGGPTTPELVAAVSNAGGLGILGAARLTPAEIRSAIQAIRRLTERPFGVNLLLAPPGAASDVAPVQRFLDRFRSELGLPEGPSELPALADPIEEQFEILLAERVPLVSLAMGDPASYVDRAHRVGARVMVMVTTVEEAERSAAAGADLLVAQGAEAGGHRSTFEVEPDGQIPLVGTLALVPQVVDAVSIPVVATGGIMDGRGIAAALALGAEGALLGTRFMLAKESGVAPAYQERLLRSTEADTVMTAVMTGRPASMVRNRMVDAYLREGPSPLPYMVQSQAAGDIYGAARRQGNADYLPLLAGQGLRLLKSGQSAAEIVGELVAQTRAVLGGLATLVDG